MVAVGGWALPVPVIVPIAPTLPREALLPVGVIPASLLDSFYCRLSISVLQVPARAAVAANSRPAAVPHASKGFIMTILFLPSPLSAGNSQAATASVGWNRVSTADGEGCSAAAEI
jgi:hypothetical protein